MNDLPKASQRSHRKHLEMVLMGKRGGSKKQTNKQTTVQALERDRNLESWVHQPSEPPFPQRKWVAP